MPLNFKEPAAGQDSPAEDRPQDKKKSAEPNQSLSHHRVFSSSTTHFAKCTIKIISCSDIPGKKSSVCPFVRVYMGSTSFATQVKKKNLTPEFNEEFSGFVDRDDQIQLKLWDNAKLERNLDSYKKIDPIGRKKVAVKELAKDGSFPTTAFSYTLQPAGELKCEISLEITPPSPGEIHIKQFNYPTWINDKYKINYIPPDFDAVKVGVSTLGRYATRWLLNQRAIMNSLNVEEEGEQPVQSEAPEGLEFELLDLSICSHSKALQLIISYQWNQKQDDVAIPDPDEKPLILQCKSFSVHTKIPKKKIHESKSIPSDSFMKSFNQVCDGTAEAIQEAHEWIKTNQEHVRKVYKLIPISTPVSHHCMVWYYR